MLNLASFRYRNALAEFGGPIASIETGTFPVRERQLVLANASLVPGLTRRHPSNLFSATADGTGVHEASSIARHMAISEALERWAFSSLVQSDAASEYGFDIDPSTCGMSAFPGLISKQARKRSVLEAVERYSLMAWWERRLEGRAFDTDWPGVSAVAINGPFGGVTAITYSRTSWGGYAYGHAAAESFTGAVERAMLEMARHELVLRSWWLSRLAGQPKKPANVFEQRIVFFATEDGYRLFQSRIDRPAMNSLSEPDVICDCELPGPWSDYATVWRFALRPPSDGHIRGGQEYFFL